MLGVRRKQEIPPLVTEDLTISTPDIHADEHGRFVLSAFPTSSTEHSREPDYNFLTIPEPSKSGRPSIHTCADEATGFSETPASPTPSLALKDSSLSRSRHPPNATLSDANKGTVVDHSSATSHLAASNATTTTCTSARSLAETLNLPALSYVTSTRGSSKSGRSRVPKGDGAALAALVSMAVPTLVAPLVGGEGWTPEPPLDQNDPPTTKRAAKWWKSLKSTVRKYSPAASGVP